MLLHNEHHNNYWYLIKRKFKQHYVVAIKQGTRWCFTVNKPAGATYVEPL